MTPPAFRPGAPAPPYVPPPVPQKQQAGEFTQMFSVPSAEPLAAKPAAPAAKEPVAAPAAGPNPKLLIIALAVFAVLAVIIVVFFALRK